MSLRRYDGSLTTAGVVIGLIVFAALFLLIWAFFDALFGAAYGADNYNPHCLTQEQALAKYPGQVIYEHTANRCWKDVKPGRAVNRTLKGGRQDTPIDASGNAAVLK